MAGSGRNILGLDIAFGLAAACVQRRDGRAFTTSGDEERPHSQSIMPLLQSIIEEAGIGWRELDVLACGIGPGSFTGLRMAAATLAGINASLRLPLIELSSLAISAAQVERDTPLYVVEDARSNLAYVGHYDKAKAMSDDCCLTWEEVRALGPAGYTAHRSSHAQLPDWSYIPPAIPRPLALSRLVAAKSERLNNIADLPRLARPAYLMSSQAERHAQVG